MYFSLLQRWFVLVEQNIFVNQWHFFFDNSKKHTVYLFTDACFKGLKDFYYKSGSINWRKHPICIIQTNAFFVSISQHARNEGINSLKLLVIFYAFEIWKDCFSWYYFIIHTNNTMVFHGLQSLQLRNASNKSLKKCLYFAATMNIIIKPIWLNSTNNALTDALF